MFYRGPSIVMLQAVQRDGLWYARILIDGYPAEVFSHDTRDWYFTPSNGLGPKMDRAIYRAFKDWRKGQDPLMLAG